MHCYKAVRDNKHTQSKLNYTNNDLTGALTTLFHISVSDITNTDKIDDRYLTARQNKFTPPHTNTKIRTPKHVYSTRFLKYYLTRNHHTKNTYTAPRYYKSRNRNATSGNRTKILRNKQTLCTPTDTRKCTQTRTAIHNQFTHVYVPYAHQPIAEYKRTLQQGIKRQLTHTQIPLQTKPLSHTTDLSTTQIVSPQPTVNISLRGGGHSLSNSPHHIPTHNTTHSPIYDISSTPPPISESTILTMW